MYSALSLLFFSFHYLCFSCTNQPVFFFLMIRRPPSSPPFPSPTPFRSPPAARVVGHVPAAALQLEARVRDEAPDLALAPGAARQRGVGDALHLLEVAAVLAAVLEEMQRDRKSTRLNSHGYISYAVFCLK